MWSPTHTQVTVQRARGLLTKGKNGTNNCFVTIALGKEKYQTSVKEKAETSVNWNEECELKIPDQGNRAELVLTCLHRNNLGIDEFLGQATLPLNEMDVYDRPRSKWFKLESKPGKEKKNKERGELEVRIAFVVKSGSLTDLSKKDKHKSSIGQLASSVGGSLLSIGQIEKRKGIKKFAKSLGSKMHLNSKKNKNKDADDNSSFSGSFVSIGTPNSSTGGGGGSRRYGQRAGDADPGVISEDEDEFVFDNLSHKSSGSSLNIQRSGLQPPTPNFAPRNPSPLLSSNGGVGNIANASAKAAGPTIIGKLNNNGGKPRLHETAAAVVEDPIDPEMEQLEIDFSVRARTLPPPSKPPRTPHSSIGKADTQLATLAATGVAATQKTLNAAAAAAAAGDDDGDKGVGDGVGDGVGNGAIGVAVAEVKEAPKLDEWESKLYGGKYLEIGNTESLKRRSWELAPVPLPTATEAEQNVNVKQQQQQQQEQQVTSVKASATATSSSSSSSLSSDTESDTEAVAAAPPLPMPLPLPPSKSDQTPTTAASLSLSAINIEPKLHSTPLEQPRVRPRSTLLSPDVEKRNFNEFNASFAKFEQRHGAKIFDSDADDDDDEVVVPLPQVKPRLGNNNAEKEKELMLQRAAAAAAQAETEAEAEQARQRAEEDARLEAELRLNEKRLREEEEAMQREFLDEQHRREAKRREEDQRLLNFAKRSTSMEEEESQLAIKATPATATTTTTNTDETTATAEAIIEHNFLTPEQSPTEFSTNNAAGSGSERREKRFGKFKYSHNNNSNNINNNINNIKRDKYNNDNESNSPSPKSTERIIIGHEKSATHAERRSEITAALSKKYEGKSREELMLIANGMENEALLQRQRVKELEDYLDNLLLRVMETHPKILQNPYSRTTSAKSG